MRYLLGFGFLIILSSYVLQDVFLKDQKRYPRVRSAIAEKQSLVETQLESKGLAINDFHLLMVAYKVEDLLVLYGKKRDESAYQIISQYEVCSRSGRLGPKRRQGDYQVPEGFYHVDRFNPASNFHLSVGLNYPNLADRRKSTFERLGGDIFIHGDCVTIGCLPMTDNNIKEIYLFSIYARNNGQERIPVYIFPFRMTAENLDAYAKRNADNQDLINFWNNLKVGYDKFIQDTEELRYSVATNGDYVFR